MTKKFEFTITGETSDRLDKTLSVLMPEYSRTFLQNMIRSGKVTADGQVVCQPRGIVRAGMVIHAEIPEITDTETVSPEPFAFEILYEDPHFLVINKPAGVVVHPAAGNHEGTVVNALLGRYPFMKEVFADESSRPGIIHRLDKNTSGCLAVAKTVTAKFKLGKAFADRTTGKTYLAICRGIPEKMSGEIKSLIGRHPVNRQKMAIVERNGKEAHTSYRVTAVKNVNGIPLSLLEVKIFTGRTHQIRVHLSSIGLPIIGDEVYGKRNCIPEVTRQMLHAWKLSLPHPETGEIMTFTSPVPQDMMLLKERIE